MENLEKRVEKIENRNKRVEADKAWETSWMRKILIAILTYAVIVIFFHFANLSKPLVNAIVPTLGFLLSTLTLSIAKNKWVNRFNKKNNGK